MSFQTLSRILKRPNEQYFLQKKIIYQKDIDQDIIRDEVGNIITKDDVGNINETWQDLQELSGVIQHRQYEKQKNRVLSITEAGEESTLRYYGYFNPTFELETDALADYRVKFIRPHETLYLKIIEYDPNNYLRGNQHHIVLGMERDRKYEGRQRHKKIPNISVTIPPIIQLGEDATISIKFPKDITGFITINDESFPIDNNIMNIPISNLPLGDNDIIIKYNGNEQYDELFFKESVTVKGDFIIETSDMTKYYSNSERFYFTIKTHTDHPVSNQTVICNFAGVFYNRITKENGTNSIPIYRDPGSYIITTQVNEQIVENTINILSTIQYDEHDIYESGEEIIATFLDSNGALVQPNTNVFFTINDQIYTRKTNEDGVGLLNIDLEDGIYNLKIENSSTSEVLKTKINIKSSDVVVIHAPSIVQTVNGENHHFIITVTNDKGKPLPNKQAHIIYREVKNGRYPFVAKYNPVTKSDGTIRIPIQGRDRPGIYEIIVTVDDVTVESKITITPA